MLANISSSDGYINSFNQVIPGGFALRQFIFFKILKMLDWAKW